MFDDDLEPRTGKPQVKNLEPLSIEELEQYIKDMEAEIERVKADIVSKKAHRDAAASVFKS